jgi:PAS domain S-box-containing protein
MKRDSQKPGNRNAQAIRDAETAGGDLEREVDRILWERARYAGLVVDSNLDIVHFRGDTDPYLRVSGGVSAGVSPGEARLHLLDTIREELIPPLREATNETLAAAASIGTVPQERAIRIKRNGDFLVNIEVRLLPATAAGGLYFLVLFKQLSDPTKPRRINRELLDLNQELTRKRDYFDTVARNYEATSESLSAASEEAQSSMEEAHRLYEELEAAAEEIQSNNDQLITLNDQLRERNSDLAILTDELNNILSGVEIPIVILGGNLCIRRFTPQAAKLLHLLPGDVGRPIAHMSLGLNLPGLDESISQVLKGSEDVWREVQASDGRWYSLRILPFMTAESKSDGVLITFVDVHDLKLSRENSLSEQRLITAVLNAARDLLVVVMDREGCILQYNRAAQELTGFSLEEVEGTRLWNTLAVPEERVQVKSRIENLSKGQATYGETHWLTKKGPPLLIAWSNSFVARDDGTVEYVICTGVDVTEREQAQLQARESETALDTLLQTVPASILAVNADGAIMLVNAASETMFGYRRQELIGHPLSMLIPERFQHRHAGHLGNFWRKPGMRSMGAGMELFGLRKDGSEFPVDVGLSYLDTRAGRLAISFISDVTERKESGAMLLQNKNELQALTARLLSLQEAGNRDLSRELHDGLSQKLAALSMEVSTLLWHSSAPDDALTDRVCALTSRINGLASEVQAISRRLHPAVLVELGLETAIREQCAGFTAQEGIPARFQARRVPEDLPEDVSLCLYRLAQEGLRNISKHANASKVKLTLSGKNNGIALRIRDNGDGFQISEAKAKGGLGLISMEERVRLVNGHHTIRSQPGRGTTVEVFVSLLREE